MNYATYSFWMSPDLWPRDDVSRGVVFLARAYDEVGQALFGLDWKLGPPPEAPTPRIHTFPSPVDGPEGTLEQRRERQIAFRRAQEKGVRPTPEWIVNAARRSDLLMKAKSALGDGLADGTLESRLRPTQGGAYSEVLDATLWVTERERLDARLRYCKMNSAEPFQDVSSVTEGEWIFVTRVSLDRFNRGSAASFASAERPTQDQMEGLMEHTIKRLWTANDKSNEFRVTQSEFHDLCVLRWPGATTYLTRPVFTNCKPAEWGPGKFCRAQSLDKLAGIYGITQKNS